MFKKLTEKEKIIFLAGVFDGEGSFGYWLKGRKDKKEFEASLESTDKDMVKRFHTFYKGYFWQRAKRKDKPDHHKISYIWKIKGEEGLKALSQMIPYMCKRRRDKFNGVVKSFRDGVQNRSAYLQEQTRFEKVNK